MSNENEDAAGEEPSDECPVASHPMLVFFDDLKKTCSPLELEVGYGTVLDIVSFTAPPRRLKPVGFWSTGPGSLLPHPNTMIDRAWNAKERRRVLKYLQTGRVKSRWMGLSHCRCGCKMALPGSADMTDEVWVWPEALPHYIEEHGVRLPADFVAYIMERS